MTGKFDTLLWAHSFSRKESHKIRNIELDIARVRNIRAHTINTSKCLDISCKSKYFCYKKENFLLDRKMS